MECLQRNKLIDSEKPVLKATGPRVAILDAIERNHNHPSAEEIYQELAESHPTLSLSTVYGTLNAFVRAGLVRKLSEVDGRLRIEGATETARPCDLPHMRRHL